MRLRLQKMVMFLSLALLLIGGQVKAGGGVYIRINQVGYHNWKRAALMSTTPLSGKFKLIDSDGVVGLENELGNSLGAWSDDYPYIYMLDFSNFGPSGTYTLEVENIVSQQVKIDEGEALYSPLLENGLEYFQTQRDGANVPQGELSRGDSHLTDQAAYVYEQPIYDSDGVLQANLVPVGRNAVDVSGGWFDAGDYVKFVHTTSFVEAVMLLMVRDNLPVNYMTDQRNQLQLDYTAEARYGIDWLNKMWDSETQTLYYQVGIGDGNGDTIYGDHDFWRLPEEDDLMDVNPGDPEYFIKYRPVLQAGEPGAPISPNLAGRLTAAFSLCYQVFYVTDPDYAYNCLHNAAQIYALAKTEDVGQLLTASPYDFYPETSWYDDMEWGAVELLKASRTAIALGTLDANAQVEEYLMSEAVKWASLYNDSQDQDTLNLYDVAALAHYELYPLLKDVPANANLTQEDLLKNRMALLDRAADTDDPFGYSMTSDPAPHAFGLAVEAKLYQRLTLLNTYARQEADWLGWGLGHNAWGTSFVVGAGFTYPECVHHQVANINGTLTGNYPMLVGAAVDGPNSPDSIDDTEEAWGEQQQCPPDNRDPFLAFGNDNWRYIDRMNSWATVEPANDYTIMSLLAFFLQTKPLPLMDTAPTATPKP